MKRETKSYSLCLIPLYCLEMPAWHPVDCEFNYCSNLKKIMIMVNCILFCIIILFFSHLFDLVCFQPDLHSMQRLCRSGVPQHHNVREPDRPRNPPGQLHRRHHYQHSVHQWSTHPIRCIQRKTAAHGRYHRANSGGYSIHMVLFGHNKSIVLNSNLYIKHGSIYPANEIKTSCIYKLFQILQKRKISFAII